MARSFVSAPRSPAFVAVAALLWLAPFPAPASALEQGGAGVAVEIVDGDTLILDNGTEVRLVGIQAPKLPLGRKGFKAWPLADEAKEALARLALGKRLALSYGGRRVDRHGRMLAHLHDPSGRWIQGELLGLGMARVYSFRDNRALVAEMLALERTARAARRGIWGHPYYAVRPAGEAGRHVGTFQLVEGRVLRAETVRSRTYLNFGEDWRTDFTISISGRDRRLFRRAGFDLEALAGRTVRVRGWLKSWNGPMIEVTHPEQIELLTE